MMTAAQRLLQIASGSSRDEAYNVTHFNIMQINTIVAAWKQNIVLSFHEDVFCFPL